ncbi:MULTISPECIES: hypothetical protein [Francisella]|uniref:hypothetical protein n=1 Tax=Francisella TaxID=262 RepID=UPI0008FC8A67|nr:MULTISPECIES: hypothetical protein [Francisella]AXH32295.1 hypothetical protein CGC44_08735 [Francisella opportunistica]AXH33944.1 hypothetical protein CGC45_08795 [Francisella opportunistica]
MDNLSTQESANAFVDALYYSRLMLLYYGKTIPFLMINDEECKSYIAKQNTSYYIPTEETFKKKLIEALQKASSEVINRFLIILNIYNKSTNNIIDLITIRLSMVLFKYEKQELKLKALQSITDTYKKNDYTKEINFSAWFESIFYIQNLCLCPEYIGDKTLITNLVKELRSNCSNYKKIMIDRQIKIDQLNFYQILMKLIQISVHRINSKPKLTRTTSLLYNILNNPKYLLIKKLINKLSIYKYIEVERNIDEAFHKKLIGIE